MRLVENKSCQKQIIEHGVESHIDSPFAVIKSNIQPGSVQGMFYCGKTGNLELMCTIGSATGYINNGEGGRFDNLGG